MWYGVLSNEVALELVVELVVVVALVPELIVVELVVVVAELLLVALAVVVGADEEGAVAPPTIASEIAVFIDAFFSNLYQ